MSEHITPRLTRHEAFAVHALLAVVLSNGDQWDDFDLQALRRADNKLTTGLDKEVAR